MRAQCRPARGLCTGREPAPPCCQPVIDARHGQSPDAPRAHTAPSDEPYRLCPSRPSSAKLLLRTLIYALVDTLAAACASAIARARHGLRAVARHAQHRDVGYFAPRQANIIALAHRSSAADACLRQLLPAPEPSNLLTNARPQRSLPWRQRRGVRIEIRRRKPGSRSHISESSQHRASRWPYLRVPKIIS